MHSLAPLKRQAYSLGITHEIARQYGDLRFRATWEKAIADQPNAIAAEVAIAEQSLSAGSLDAAHPPLIAPAIPPNPVITAPTPTPAACIEGGHSTPQPEPDFLDLDDLVFDPDGVPGVVLGFTRGGQVLVRSMSNGRVVKIDRSTISSKREAVLIRPARPDVEGGRSPPTAIGTTRLPLS